MSVTGARQATTADRTREAGSPVKEQVEPAASRAVRGNQAALRRSAPSEPVLREAVDEAVDGAIAPPERDERDAEEAEETEPGESDLVPQRAPAPPAGPPPPGVGPR